MRLQVVKLNISINYWEKIIFEKIKLLTPIYKNPIRIFDIRELAFKINQLIDLTEKQGREIEIIDKNKIGDPSISNAPGGY